MKDIQKRIIELDNRLNELVGRPKRTQGVHHREEIAETEGEIKGLRWVLAHCFYLSEPNIIEQ